jgi:hypothetical protein
MAQKPTSAPVVGFNHNVQYKGKVYHIQTEDSGLPFAHYITHLFVGGNILASKKSSYAELAPEGVAPPELAPKLRKLMEGQHKEVIKNLIAGKYDAATTGTFYDPGKLGGDAAGVKFDLMKPEAGMGSFKSQPVPDAPAAAEAQLPPDVLPEVIEARKLKEKPKIVDTNPHQTFFGEDLISAKSLDDVILDYLAELYGTEQK